MLVFVDESYKQSDHPSPKTTFSAVLVPEGKYREFDTELLKLKKYFWKVDNHYEFELKGRELLSEKAINLPRNREFVLQLQSLCRLIGIVTFAVVQDGTITLASQSDFLPDLYRALARRINTYMEEKRPNENAILFFDDIDDATNYRVAISFNNFMYRHYWGARWQAIVPTAFFCNSRVTPPMQVADLVAYCVNERYCGRRGHIENFFRGFRDLTFNYEVPDENIMIWGFQMIGKEKPVVEESPAAIAEEIGQLPLPAENDSEEGQK